MDKKEDCYVAEFLMAMFDAVPEHVYYNPSNNEITLATGFKAPKISWGSNIYYYIGAF